MGPEGEPSDRAFGSGGRTVEFGPSRPLLDQSCPRFWVRLGGLLWRWPRFVSGGGREVSPGAGFASRSSGRRPLKLSGEQFRAGSKGTISDWRKDEPETAPELAAEKRSNSRQHWPLLPKLGRNPLRLGQDCPTLADFAPGLADVARNWSTSRQRRPNSSPTARHRARALNIGGHRTNNGNFR